MSADHADDGLVTLADAAERLDVHYMTAYRYVRTGRMFATKKGGKWWVAPDDLAAVLAEGTGRRASNAGPRELLVAPFTARLVQGDTAGCWDLISDALAGGASPAEVHSDLLSPALVQVGEQWRAGNLSVADEHRATATASRLLGQMGPMFRHRGRRRGTVVLGSVAGDAHAMPSAMLADLLTDRRFEVVDLGANTPAESFVSVIDGIDDLVGVGVCATLDSLVPIAVSTLVELRKAVPEGTLLLAGGRALANADDAELLAVADVVSANAEAACSAFDQARDRGANQGAPEMMVAEGDA